MKKYLLILISTLLMMISFFAYFDYSNFNFTSYVFIFRFITIIGVFLFSFLIISWMKLTKHKIDFYLIFIIFYFLFLFSKSVIMIGKEDYYFLNGYDTMFNRILTIRDYIAAQIISINLILSLHIGAVLALKCKPVLKVRSINKVGRHEILLYSILLSIIVIPATFLIEIDKMLYSLEFGYKNLYYGDYSEGLISLIQLLFIPCLCGILLGSNFSKKSRIFVYSNVFFFILICMIYGERGSWIYMMLILISLEYLFLNKIKISWKIIPALFVMYIGLEIVYAFVEVRNDFNINNFLSTLFKGDEILIFKIFDELGKSIAIHMIIYSEEITFQYNTYLFGSIGSVSNSIFTIFGIEFNGISSWFSSEVLNLVGWGAGFSMVGELILNYNVYICFVIAIFIGFVIIKSAYILDDDVIFIKLLKIIFMYLFLKLIRGTYPYEVKEFVFRFVVFFIPLLILSNILDFKRFANKAIKEL